MAVRAYKRPQKFFHPLQAFFILDVGQGVFHGILCVEVGEIHFSGRAGGFVLVDYVLLDCRTVEHDIPFFCRELPEGNIRADTHFSCDILHQRPHEGLPGQNSAFVNTQILIRHES